MEREQQHIQNKLDEAKNQFISTIAQNMGLYGVSDTNGRLYGTMLFAERPMTLDDMSEALGMSKMSMSTGIRALMDAGMVERVWEKGVRKDLYQSNDDWYQSFTSVFVNRWREASDNNQNAARRAKEEFESCLEEAEDPLLIEELQHNLEKINYALSYYEWLDEVIRIFESGEIFTMIPLK
ncbi:GbsR/MarR family transcriptional regulator [Marinococcus luteus]|uniref:GbsR/MarR family transcriptional regulator n=1 Tax=Marinococcus luteus TaxID=1122204 RepID=UPI002ACC51F9|nr:GbsR/MarR family transcriptional regulator [Marinococcus luteus]MDZ5784063.1 GbsR/MarR family transcriptional regulator [Marinococcus luteus]